MRNSQMCIKLHLEEQVGYINEKQINVNELYNLKKNCYGLKKKNSEFRYELGNNVNYSGFMTCE
jgi:hypothetical protein